MKRATFLLFTFFLFASIPAKAFASENFSIASDVTYTVREDETANASFAVTLTNKTDKFYASSYTIEIGFEDVYNVSASDPDGPITPRLTKTQKGQRFELLFNSRVVGLVNSLPFRLSFDTKEIAKKQGRIWEVNIPGISNASNFSDFSVNVVVPQSFGEPAYIKPYTNQATVLRFSKDQLQESGISIAYGDKQTYQFSLSYHLRNSNLFPVRGEIALPPDTSYQKVFIESIDPEPLNVALDEDGNWLAQYTLLPSERRDVKVTGFAQISLLPKQTREQGSLTRYLKETEHWQVSDPNIKKVADQLKTPSAIYQYVVSTLRYDYTRVTENKPRLGAAKALSSPSSAVCLEFTDLFIALLRAAGIPAREVNGFAYTRNAKQRPLSLVKDILHAWPEYYDKNLATWVMVDPTWGNTTGGVDYFNVFDFDHLAFVVKGKHSDYPIPAGGYKLRGGEEQKDVEVSLSQVPVSSLDDSFLLAATFPDKASSFFPVRGTITLKNLGKTLLPPQMVSVSSSLLSPKNQKVISSPIPPFGKQTIKIGFNNPPFLTDKADTITIAVGDKRYTHRLAVSSLQVLREIAIGGVGLGSIALSIFIITKGARRLPLLR